MSEPVDELRAILSRHFRAPGPGELRDNLDLGPAGFGLDSIALTELLIACEDHFGGRFPPALFDEGPLTVGRLAAHIRHVRQIASD